MPPKKAIRYQGRITTWKDEQGFGFITPNGGGPTVFVHIKSFASGRRRPSIDAIVTYELAAQETGKPRAGNVALVRDKRSREDQPGPVGFSTLFAIAFLAVLSMLSLSGRLPSRIFGAYAGMSAIAFLAYYIDKAAARKNRWRTREDTLHMLALLCGWPGALLAQQMFRHKSKKLSFRHMLRLTIVANCMALGYLLTPAGMRTFGPSLGMP